MAFENRVLHQEFQVRPPPPPQIEMSQISRVFGPRATAFVLKKNARLFSAFATQATSSRRTSRAPLPPPSRPAVCRATCFPSMRFAAFASVADRVYPPTTASHAQISKLEIAQLMHRLTKVEHVQEELLRILMQPTALMVAKDASAMASTGYDTSPTVVKSVLESLYKQVREGRGHHHAADLVAATQAGVAAARGLARGSGLGAGRFGVYDPAQIKAIYGNLASRGVADEAAAGGPEVFHL